MKKMMMHMQTLFLLFRFVPLRRNKVFWLAQAVPEEFTPLCSFVPYIYKDLRGAKHTLQCIQASFFSFGEPAEERYITGTWNKSDNERINIMLIKGFLPVPFSGTRGTRWNNT
jgi:hypothetical protein